MEKLVPQSAMRMISFTAILVLPYSPSGILVASLADQPDDSAVLQMSSGTSHRGFSGIELPRLPRGDYSVRAASPGSSNTEKSRPPLLNAVTRVNSAPRK